MQTRSIKIESMPMRIVLIAIGLVFLLILFFAARWFFGNSIAMRVFQTEVADLAVTLAPNDPQTHLALGSLYERSPAIENLSKAFTEYEKAVALSPNDYRLWIAYGKALEREGNAEGAVKALQKASELAPNYAAVQWTYGNILLRQGKNVEAFALIRKAVEGDSKYAGPAATTAWDIFEGDLDDVKKNVGDSNAVRSALAVYLANQKRFGEALELRNSLPENARKNEFKKDGEKIYSSLLAEKKYRSALRIRSEIGDEKAKGKAIGKISNGGFEEAMDVQQKDIFEWQIADGRQPVIGGSIEQKRSGEKSLVINFNSITGKDFRNVSQTVAVESEKKYTFQVFYRSNLKTSATLKWEIVDAESGKVLASTDAVEKNSDWSSVSAEFTTDVETQGIIVRLVREKCTTTDCSISGNIWFDDISLN